MTGRPANFSLTEARRLVKDLFKPNPVIYWVDFLATILIGHTCFLLTRDMWRILPEPAWRAATLQLVCFVVNVIAYYRAIMFIHELVHLRHGTFRLFRFMWNLICGIPLLTPSFLYYSHIDHHRRKRYGTQHDGEYLPITHQGRSGIVRFLLQAPVIPFLAALRFAVLPPLCWIFPPLRKWVQQHASSMVVDPSYIRPLPSKKTRQIMFVQELLCFLWCWAALGLPFLSRDLPWNVFLVERLIPFLVQAYLLALAILTVNHLRSLGSHRFANAGGEMSFVEQLLDSVNVSRAAWISELWGPVGTRLHALHHLFPSLPYHALPEAHRRLMRHLPADSPYRQTVQASLNETLRDIWRRASAAESSLDSDEQMEANRRQGVQARG